MIATLILVSSTAVRASNEVYYTNRENIDMTEEEYNNLLGLGFTENQIARMDYNEFVENKDLKATRVEEEKQHIKTTYTIRNGIKSSTSTVISEEELQEALATNQLESMQSFGPTYNPNTSGNFYDGLTYDTYRTLTSYIAIFTDPDYDEYARYKMDMYWDTMPNTRSHDIIGITIQPDRVHIATVIKFRQDWYTTGGTFGHSIYGYEKIEDQGGSYVYELPTGSMQALEAYIYFNVRKNNGVGTINTLLAGGDFAHAYNSVSYQVKDNYHLYTAGGIYVLNPYYANYDETGMAVAAFYGTW